jgi:hypothetical protein
MHKWDSGAMSGPQQPPPYPGPQYPGPQYPPPQNPPPQQQTQQPGYPPQQYLPPQPYPPAQPQYPPQPQYQQPYGGQPIVIPVEGKGAAKLAARMRPRSLIISPEGFAHEGKQGSFRVGWAELRRITITTAYHQDKTKLVAPKTWRVRVIMDAADPSFGQRHPELAGLEGKYGGSGPGSYGLPLGPAPNLVPQLAQALATYGSAVFGGVVEEGQVFGFGYL